MHKSLVHPSPSAHIYDEQGYRAKMSTQINYLRIFCVSGNVLEIQILQAERDILEPHSFNEWLFWTKLNISFVVVV